MDIKPHSPAWYDRLAQMQRGYYFPWRSKLAGFNGEEAYDRLVRRHLSPAKDVLDVGCGHGEFTLTLAAACRSILAYDRVASYIEIAQGAARETGIRNVTFVCSDSSAGAQGRPLIPADPGSFDLLISRRGPLNYIEDARRVARPGAALIQLNPMETPQPPWHKELPEALRFEPSCRPFTGSMLESVEHRLGLGGLRLHSHWTFDVPETFDDPEQFYIMLTWGRARNEVPQFGEIAEALERIFSRHAGRDGLAVRHRRLLWKAVVD